MRNVIQHLVKVPSTHISQNHQFNTQLREHQEDTLDLCSFADVQDLRKSISAKNGYGFITCALLRRATTWVAVAVGHGIGVGMAWAWAGSHTGLGQWVKALTEQTCIEAQSCGPLLKPKQEHLFRDAVVACTSSSDTQFEQLK